MSRLDDDEGRLGRQTWVVTRGPNQKKKDDKQVDEFWSLVWQEQARVIVMLTKTFECIKVMCVQYWPNAVGAKENYGDIDVTLVKEELFAHYKVMFVTFNSTSSDPLIYL